MTEALGRAADTWATVFATASTPQPPKAWRACLARALCEALGPSIAVSVGVVTTPLDRMEEPEILLWPDENMGPLMAWARRVIPAMSEGYPWREVRAHQGLVYVPDGYMPPEASAAMRSAMAEVGARGVVLALVLSRCELADAEYCAGYLVFNTHVSEIEFIARYGAQIRRVAEVAGATLSASIALARELSRPAPPKRLLTLTPRERQIAELAAAGFSDLNIAARLGIGEATVGTHLHRAFRKLGVHTRVELVGVMQQGAA